MINIYGCINKARKAGDKTSLSVFQALLSELQKYETSKGAKPLDDAKQLEIFNKYAKNLEDSILQFQKANREDLITQYTSELEVVKKLLPEPADGVEIKDFIESDKNFFDKFWTIVEDYTNDAINNSKHLEMLIPKKNMGEAIKYVKNCFPTTDGKLISTIIKSYIRE